MVQEDVVHGFQPPSLEQFNKDVTAVWKCTSNKVSVAEHLPTTRKGNLTA